MAGSDANVRETVKEVMGEVKDQTNVTPTTETKEQTSKSPETETKSAEPVFVSGIDISDVAEQDRPRIQKALEDKAKLLEKGYQGKFKEVASFKKAQDDLVKAGLSVDEAKNVLQQHIDKKNAPTQTEKKKANKILDNLIETAPLEQKETLRQLRQIVAEETDSSALQKRVKEMEQQLRNVSMGYTDVRKKDIDVQIGELTKEYGEDLVEKYRDVITEDAMKFNVSPEKALFFKAESSEIKQAISQKKTKSNRTQEKVNAITNSNPGVASSTEQIDIKKTSLKDIIKSVTSLKK